MIPSLSLATCLKLGVAFAFIAGAALFTWHYESVVAGAARVPALESRIASDDNQAVALSTRLAAVDAARQSADRALDQWQRTKASVLQPLSKEDEHAPAAKNPACLPSARDRSLRNAALAKLTSFDGASGAARVSAAAHAAQ